MKIGLYFGSFNPIHNGHLIIANHVLNVTDVDKIWFVVSPQNPLKPANSLLNEYHRLHLVNIAIEDNPDFKASNIEFKLPKPSYTIDTMTYLEEQYPDHEFCLIIGSDSYQNLSKWKNHEMLRSKYRIFVYQRPGFVTETQEPNIQLLNAPLIEISSTFIRNLIKEKKSIRYLVPDNVRKEITENRYFR